jgi:hypothetical protein
MTFPQSKMPGARPGIFLDDNGANAYAAWSGNTASILVFSVAALNGLTI